MYESKRIYKMTFDLLAFVRELTRKRGINPVDYEQTLKEANGKRWGASSVIRADGVGIDVVFQEFKAHYPSMFEGLDDFVEALAERLGRKKGIEDKFDQCEVAECEQNKDTILVEVQSKPILNVLEREVMEESGLVSREAGKRKVSITPKGIKRLVEMSIGEI